jgi:SAM-dependent methyltransferase
MTSEDPMSLVEINSRQYDWRRWSDVYPYLGDLSGARVVDLGCGIGDQVRDLSRLGAHVLGMDGNHDFIDHAKSRGIPRARFVCGDITDIKDSELKSDGVWTSFTAAYFPRFDVLTRSIDMALKPGGWLAITEVDDLFGHEPLHSRWSALIERYYGIRFRIPGMFDVQGTPFTIPRVVHPGLPARPVLKAISGRRSWCGWA